MRFWKLDSIGMNCNDAFRPRLREIKGRRRREREKKNQFYTRILFHEVKNNFFF